MKPLQRKLVIVGVPLCTAALAIKRVCTNDLISRSNR
jgi:hypothetical protein